MSLRSKMWMQVVCTLALAIGLGAWAPDGHAAGKQTPVHAAKKKSKRVVVAKHTARRSVAKVANMGRKHAVVRSAVPVQTHASGALSSAVISVSTPSAATGEHGAGALASTDDLGLRSNAVLVIDQETHKVLLGKNASAVLPIASLTKLMTGLVVTDAGLPMEESITITQDDVDTLKGSSSRLAVGTTLTRGELMHLALMSSENRAAHALGRTFPGGIERFVETMNVKAKLLGMLDTQYVDPTGLSPQNRSSAKDLSTLASVAYERPMMRALSTSPGYEVATGRRVLQYRNTNQLVNNPHWDIGLQKTGYIAEAGRCLLMQATVAGRQLIMVFLDSAGKLTRIADAERVRKYLESQPSLM